MRALLLSAGFGKRLRPLTNDIPKCLVPISNKPLLQHWLEMLTEAGISKILVNLHYLPDKVKHFITNSMYEPYVTIVYEEKLLGTGGTLLKNRAFFANGSIMLIHADNLSLFDMNAFIRSHKQRPIGTDITMMTFITQTPESCGIVEVDNHSIVSAFHEKVKNPTGNLASAAVFIVEPSVVDFLAGIGKEEIDFSAEVIPRYVGRINTFHNSIYHRDIGTLENLQLAQAEYPRVYQKFIGGGI